jgi:hypothetical protein
MKVGKHHILAPPTNTLNDTGADTATEQGHVATGTTGANSCGGTDGFGDEPGLTGAPGSGRGIAHGTQQMGLREVRLGDRGNGLG